MGKIQNEYSKRLQNQTDELETGPKMVIHYDNIRQAHDVAIQLRIYQILLKELSESSSDNIAIRCNSRDIVLKKDKLQRVLSATIEEINNDLQQTTNIKVVGF